MSVIGSNVLAGASGQGGGYNLTNSLRFRSSASAYLSRTPASASDRQKWTWSGWVKRGAISSGSYMDLFTALTDGNNFTEIRFHFNANDDTLVFTDVAGGTTYGTYSTNVYRDPSAWYHIVCSVDTTQATSTNRVKLYVNGVQVTQNAGGSGYPLQNTNTSVNGAVEHRHGGVATYGRYFDGYLAEINFVDGQALTPSSFGETSTSTGVWIPKKYTGTYGTNGFYLKFTDTTSTSTLGTDFSGNSNTWTVNNISLTAGTTYDSMTDVPTLTSATASNYCVLNPIFNVNGTNVTYSNGNLTFSHPANSGNAQLMAIRGTIALPAGKYYWEYTVGATVNDQVGIGNNVALGGSADGTAGARYLNSGAFQSNYTNPSSAASYTTNDIIGVAYDQPNGTLAFYKNNSLQGTITNISTTEVFFPSRSPSSSGTGGAGSFNFGQQPFAYTPPTGFVGLNTFNLPTPTIGATASTTANKYMDANTYAGNGQAISSGGMVISSLNFQPDFVWIKDRTSPYSHNLSDVLRGASTRVYSNLTNAEDTNTESVNTFNSNGFTVGNNVGVNTNGNGYVSWNWKAGGTGVTNTAGSITSTVSANTTAGFSIVTYTGTGSNATVGHGLGVAPKMIFVKSRNNGGTYYDWAVYNSDIGAGNAMLLNSTSGSFSKPSYWNSTTATSTVFTLGSDITVNQSSATYVAYCFAQVAGYSAFGSYTGNGSTDGPFNYTGFRPAYVMIKRTDSANWWQIWDKARNPENVVNKYLAAQTGDAEYTASSPNDLIDFTANGFKIRGSNNAVNANGGTYIYMAFCESPFKFSNAR